MRNEKQAYLAHVRLLPDGQWAEHTLDEHLREVAKLAGKFAGAFNSADWAANADAIALVHRLKPKQNHLLGRISTLELDYYLSPIQQQGGICEN